jgi:glyoxalase family protein
MLVAVLRVVSTAMDPFSVGYEVERRGYRRSSLSSEAVRLEGIHHVTAITAEAQPNVDFYAGVLGLRMVKKTVNQDNPTVYHLFYADEKADPGSDITFFEYPGIPRGRAGDGMIHRVLWRVASIDALDFWARRLGEHGVETQAVGDRLRFADPEGLGHELLVPETDDEPLTADHPEVPAEHALQGFDGVRAYSSDPDASRSLLEETLGFTARDGLLWESRGESRGSTYAYDEPPTDVGLQGAGSVHHVAWASPAEEHEAWRERVIKAGMHATPVIDRFYFRSVYFREPSGVLFEIATIGPGFAVDEPMDHLGEKLSLPPFIEHMRDEIEAKVRPITNPRQVTAGT